MALNQVQVVGPRSEPQTQKKEQKSDIDKLLEGLQVANGVLGIGVNYTTIQKHMAEQQALDDANTGVLTAKDRQTAVSQGLQPTAEGTPGSQTFSYRTGEGDTGITKQAFILPEKKATPLQSHAINNYKDPKTGEVGTALVDPSDGTLRGFVAQQTAPKEAKTREITTLDKDGKPVTMIVEDKPGSVFPSQGKGDKDKTPENTTNLRKEYDAHPTTKTTNALGQFYSKIEGSATKADPTGASDISLVYSYMRMLDPNSSVREGEYATAQNSGGIPDKIRALYNGAKDGQKLTPEMRQGFLGEARGLMKAQLDSQDEQDARFAQIAKANGVPPEQVLDPSVQKLRERLDKALTGTPKPGSKEDGVANAAPEGATTPAAYAHPEAGKALKWANENRLSKNPEKAAEAMAILQRLGTK